MKISAAIAFLCDEVGQVLGQSFRKGGYERSLFGPDSLFNLAQQMLDLISRRIYENLRVDKAGRSDYLLNHFAAASVHLERPGRCRDEDNTGPVFLKLLESKRPVIKGAGQSETVLDEDLLSAFVARPHRLDLRDSSVRFVDKQQKVFREIINQCIRPCTRSKARQMPCVIFNPAAVADLLHHLDVVHCSCAQALGLQQLAFAAELF